MRESVQERQTWKRGSSLRLGFRFGGEGVVVPAGWKRNLLVFMGQSRSAELGKGEATFLQHAENGRAAASGCAWSGAEGVGTPSQVAISVESTLKGDR